MSTMSPSFAQNKYMDDLATLPAALMSYIPKQLRRQVDWKKVTGQSDLEYVQSVWDNSNDNLRVYGSAESLLKNLQIYMDFPLRRTIFPQRMGNYYHTVPVPYRTLKGDVLYCKQDYLFHLQSCAYSDLRISNNQQRKYAIEYMQKHEERLGGCYEFVKYDHEVFEKIRELFYNAASLQPIPENVELTYTVGQLKAIEYKEKDFVKVFDDLTFKYPWLFLPNSETEHKNATAVVRVFYDNNLQFVMESELLAALNLKNPDCKPLECMDTDGHYRTIEYKLVLKAFREDITDIDFIYHPIRNCDHRTVPIVAPTGDHCIQAADAFMEILNDTFQVSGVFQKLTRNTCHMIPKFVSILEKYFPSNIKYRYFINLKVLQKLREELDEFWKPIEDRPVKRVRNFGPNGHMVEDVKKELKRLGYTDIFPEIRAAARLLCHGTANMFVAIDCCLMEVMFKRFPCLGEFMFRQKSCSHIRAKPCDYCLNAFKGAEARIEAEKEAEQASISSAAAAATNSQESKPEPEISETGNTSNLEKSDNSEPNLAQTCENLENPEESNLEPVTSEAENTTNSETIELKNEQPAENSEPNLAERCRELEKMIKEKDEKINELSEKEKILNPKNEYFKSTVKEVMQQVHVELEKFIEEKDEEINELSEREKSLNQEKEDFEATVNKMLRQLVDKDKEINKLKKANSKSEKSMVEELRKHNNSFTELEKRLSQGLAQLKNKDSRIQELEVKNSKINVEKNVEIEKLKKQQESLAKEIEQMKRNASKSADEVKKMAAKITEKEDAENRLKQSNKELLEKLRKFDSNLQEITKKNSHLETEITSKNRIIQELQNSAKKQVAEQEKAKKELETMISTIRGVLDRNSPPEPTEKPECLFCFEEMKPDQKTLKCEHCRKMVHFECGSKWLEIHRSCAHCRQEMLNPDEYPNLQ